MGEKVGRPSSDGERFPCGKLKPRVSGVEIRRILDNAVKTAREQRFGSEVGRLLLSGKITADDAATCFEIANIYGAFDRLDGKRRAARSPAYESGYGQADHHESKERLQQHADAKRRFTFLDDTLSGFPARARTVIETLCVENLSVNAGDPALLDSLRGLLQFIASELERFDTEENARMMRERRKTKPAVRKTRQERLEADEYVLGAPTGDADTRRARREKRISAMLERNAARGDMP